MSSQLNEGSVIGQLPRACNSIMRIVYSTKMFSLNEGGLIFISVYVAREIFSVVHVVCDGCDCIEQGE